MNQEERRIYLIKELQKEMPQYREERIPCDEKGQRDLLRALLNVREPMKASEEFLKVQDEYLKERAKEKGITDTEDLKPAGSDPRLYLWQGDITTLKCDMIMNAANGGMTGCYVPLHGCEDNMVHSFAGVQLRYDTYLRMEELRKQYGEGYEQPTGVPMVTNAYNLPAKYVLHIVGPVDGWRLTKKNREDLEACYKAALDEADEKGCVSIAFCCLSTGVFHFPQDIAAEIAVRTTKEWLDSHKGASVKKVIFNVFKDSDLEIYRELLGK